MKDLYAGLGLEPDVRDEELARVIAEQDEAADARAVLLNRQRRADYDHCWATLRAIGKLRQRLKLDSEPTWFTRECGDFIPSARPKPVAPLAGDESALSAAGSEGPEMMSESERSWAVPLVIVVAIAATVAAWFLIR
jgi:hypothetical protein